MVGRVRTCLRTGRLGQGGCLAGLAATASQNGARRAARSWLDAVQCWRRGERPALVRLVLAALGQSYAAHLASLVASPAESEYTDRPDGLCGLCPPGDRLGGSGADRRGPLDH